MWVKYFVGCFKIDAIIRSISCNNDFLFSCSSFEIEIHSNYKTSTSLLFVSAKFLTAIQMVGDTLIHCDGHNELKWNEMKCCRHMFASNIELWMCWNEKLMIKHWNVFNFLVLASLFWIWIVITYHMSCAL